MFEHKTQPLAPKRVFYKRFFNNFLVACMILAVCLIIGITGYHFLAGANWIDSLHNASMILSGMGPVIEIKNTVGKLFSSFYALFSGVVFITNIGLLLSPVIHRVLHRFHLEQDVTPD